MQENCHDAGHKVFLAMTCFCRGGDMQPAYTRRRGPHTAPNTIRPCRRLLLSRSPPGKAHTLADQAQQQVLAVDVAEPKPDVVPVSRQTAAETRG